MQVDVLQTLNDERALHMLPPLALLPGPPHAYLDPPAAASQNSNRLGVDVYLALLAGSLPELCLSTWWARDSSSASAEGCGAPLGPAVVLHRLAVYIFGDDVDSGAAPEAAGKCGLDAQRTAVLRAAIRRCGHDAAHRQLLALLLRWDLAAGQPSDVIPSQRLAFIQAACVQDSSGDELLATVMNALDV